MVRRTRAGRFWVVFQNVVEVEETTRDLPNEGEVQFVRVCPPYVVIRSESIERHYPSKGMGWHIFLLKDTVCEEDGSILKFTFTRDGKDISGIRVRRECIYGVIDADDPDPQKHGPWYPR